ncbi:MAG: DnaJ C-terminal domain-containing protein [Chloroflexota bacterium]
MEYKDYYKVLGVTKKATEKEIRDAYRRLARKSHPDVNPNDKRAEERFKEIGEAYAVLSDTEKRRKYDQVGPSWDPFTRSGSGAGRPTQSPFTGTRTTAGPAGNGRVDLGDLGDLGGSAGGAGGLGGFSDFFESLFGQAGRTSSAAGVTSGAPTAAEQPVEITLAEAYSGVERQLEVEVPQPCPICSGSGRYNGTVCYTCGGTGKQMRSRRIEAKIPAGVDTGSRVALRGGSAAGDIILLIKVLPDPNFRREDNNLYTEVPVDLTTALLGGEVSVPTPAGKRLLLKIPAESANGQQFMLRGQGMPRLQGEGRGDLYAKLSVVLPRHLTERERELLTELAQSRTAATAGR